MTENCGRRVVPWSRSSPLPLPSDFPSVSREIVEDAVWELFRIRNWQYPGELIFRKEGRAAYSSNDAIASLPEVFGVRVLGLSDN